MLKLSSMDQFNFKRLLFTNSKLHLLSVGRSLATSDEIPDDRQKRSPAAAA
jgi:hypothetical protein